MAALKRRARKRRRVRRLPPRTIQPVTTDVAEIMEREGLPRDVVERLLWGTHAPKDRERYYRTPHWRATCDAAYEYHGHACRLCGREATQVHHVAGLGAYQAMFRETMEMVTPLCNICHKRHSRGRR